jgi:xanthine dehydrogenase accessory factor
VTTLWRALAEAAEAGEHVALCTVVGVDGSAPRSSGARMLVWPDGRILGTVGGGALEHRAIAAALDALRVGSPTRLAVHLTRDLGMCCGGAMEVYIEPQAPEDRLVVYGAGHVGRATARIACDLGFRVTVVDEREDWADPEAFPASAVVRCEDPLRHARSLATDARTYLFVTTHVHALDQDLIETLLPRDYAWLGLIGSRSKAARFFLRLKAAGVDESLFTRVSTPVGLDLGAETPAEIAVSIAAELVQVRRGHRGPVAPLSAAPLPARGGEGVATPPRLRRI